MLSRVMWSQVNQGQPTADKAKQELLELENRWLEVENDPNALDTILAPDFVHVVPVGIITKDEQLSFLRTHPSARELSSRHFEDMHVRVYGNVGVVNGIVVAAEAKGTRRTLFTDVFVYRDGKWQAVNAQELPAANRED
jgi:hypothetical protein